MPTQRSSDNKNLNDLRPSDRRLLRLVGEHGAIPLDLLIRLADSNSHSTHSRTSRLQRDGFLRATTYPVDKHFWFTLTPRALPPLNPGYRVDPPDAVTLDHRRALIEACLQLTSEFPTGHWITLDDPSFPDALFDLDDQRWAIKCSLDHQLPLNPDHYDKLILFCSDPSQHPNLPDRLELRKLPSH